MRISKRHMSAKPILIPKTGKEFYEAWPKELENAEKLFRKAKRKGLLTFLTKGK